MLGSLRNLLKVVSTICWVLSTSKSVFTLVHDQVVGLSFDVPLANAGEEETCDSVFIADHSHQLIALGLSDIALHVYKISSPHHQNIFAT